jgi:hypothetical protein
LQKLRQGTQVTNEKLLCKIEINCRNWLSLMAGLCIGSKRDVFGFHNYRQVPQNIAVLSAWPGLRNVDD